MTKEEFLSAVQNEFPFAEFVPCGEHNVVVRLAGYQEWILAQRFKEPCCPPPRCYFCGNYCTMIDRLPFCFNPQCSNAANRDVLLTTSIVVHSSEYKEVEDVQRCVPAA